MVEAQSVQMSTIGDRIRTLREQRGWSRPELGRRAGIASQTVMRIEDGETAQPTQHIVEKIARAFGVPYPQLWGAGELPDSAPPMMGPQASADARSPIDVCLLSAVIEALEGFLASHAIAPPIRRKAEIIAYLYAHYAAHGAMKDEAFINFMRIVLPN